MADSEKPTAERRRATRFSIRAPAIFVWADAQGKQNQGGGFTRDVAINSAFVWCHMLCPPEQTKISVEVLLPKLAADAEPIRFYGEGTVTRVDVTPAGRGFAVICNEDSALWFSKPV